MQISEPELTSLSSEDWGLFSVLESSRKLTARLKPQPCMLRGEMSRVRCQAIHSMPGCGCSAHQCFFSCRYTWWKQISKDKGGGRALQEKEIHFPLWMFRENLISSASLLSKDCLTWHFLPGDWLHGGCKCWPSLINERLITIYSMGRASGTVGKETGQALRSAFLSTNSGRTSTGHSLLSFVSLEQSLLPEIGDPLWQDLLDKWTIELI